MAGSTPNYGLIVPQVGDNVIVDIVQIGNSNTIIDTTMNSLNLTDINLQSQITNNYNTLDTKIDTQDNIINSRVDNLILNVASLPEVVDARFSSVWNITFTILTDRLNYDEQKILDTEIAVNDVINNYMSLIRLGGIG